jgi:hypothetical protein
LKKGYKTSKDPDMRQDDIADEEEWRPLAAIPPKRKRHADEGQHLLL